MLMLFVAGVPFLAGPPHSLLVSVQLFTLALAGACDPLAAVNTRLTGHVPWHKWSGGGSILLGMSLPLGLVPTGGWVTDDLGMLGAMTLAGLTSASIGFETLLFGGEHIFDIPPGGTSSSSP
ncbi:hypothetical protein [Salinigranum sp. GCM10025319]|uniref:hypothetical protein n=1 Tax=Salinigranum sp. GCM10025319 TaxID=3252687 RepID=UPI0036220ABD